MKMDNDEIGSFAVAGANDPNRDREMAVKALTAVGFTEAAGVFSPPSNSTVNIDDGPLTMRARSGLNISELRAVSS